MENLNIIGKLELNENKLLNVFVADNLNVYLYDGKKIIHFNAKIIIIHMIFIFILKIFRKFL